MRKTRYKLPLLPLRGITVFPGTIIHFDVGRPQSIAAVKAAMNEDKLIYLCYQKDITVEHPLRDDLAEIGTIAEIHQMLNLPDGNLRVLVEGIHRGKITSYADVDKYVQVNVSKKDDIYSDDFLTVQVLMRRAMHLTEDFLDVHDRLSQDMVSTLMSIDDPAELADVIIFNFPFKPQYRQEILDELDVTKRLEKLISIMSSEIEILSLEKNITAKTQKSMDENQREYMLREKLKVIHAELGDDETETEINGYRKKLKGRNIPKEVLQKLEEEFNRLRKTHPSSQEYGVIQNYIDTIIDIPWNNKTTDLLDVNSAAKILDRDHFGLDKIKERILEYIAVRSIGGNPKSNIICLVGPPGTGKTSIAKSLAEALGRKYIRVSLGGVKSEAEIRGHRKTYVGAMPGRIIEAVKKVGVSNPLMLFDEIDKMSSDITGDPASAMLEVLDPEQNKNFRDNFVELPFDLSDIIFVTTANSLDTIPRPLLDRMDIIETESYTREEKIVIAKKFLLPKQRKQHGLSASALKFSPPSFGYLIDFYTRESGVRELERKISAICRKTALKIAKGEIKTLTVSKSNIKDILGVELYRNNNLQAKDKIGVVTGLAWTSVGGETLSVEVSVMQGTGKLELTGNMGDVMSESAKAAVSYVRSNTLKLGIDDSVFKNSDIHIHIPEGAVPKDGPSAGITIATAIISALTGRAVHHDVAMTGEITLRGNVLLIGGLKEKTLAALRFGIKTVVIPSENKCDYEELPDVVKKNIKFVFAEHMDDVTDIALLPVPKSKTKIKSDVYIEKYIKKDSPVKNKNIN